MRNIRLITLVGLCLVAACDSGLHTTAVRGLPLQTAVTADKAAGAENPNTKLAYRHELGLQMSGASIQPRFERARNRCLKDASLGCVVLEASIMLTSGYNQPHALLRVRLPHSAVEPFEQDALSPLPGEKPGDALLHSKSTTAEDLTQAIADADRRLAQLIDYRDRLTALLKRPDAKVDELIRIQSELSTTQSQIEAITEQKRRLDEQVSTEIVAINFTARGDFEERNPIAGVWNDGLSLLSESAANALSFTIRAIPWLPLIAIGFGVIIGLRKGLRRLRRGPL